MSKLYDSYSNCKASEVPEDSLKIIITDFIIEAALDMGQKPDEGIYDRVTYFILKDFRYFQMIELFSTFRRGALGQFGAGRLVPRTIYGWLISVRNENAIKATGAAEKIDPARGYDDLHKFPLGKAINKKIDWLTYGAITSDEWDLIPLKEVAELIANHKECYPALFGIYHD
jgi:hypothetical protein